jgi:hypothetical protein
LSVIRFKNKAKESIFMNYFKKAIMAMIGIFATITIAYAEAPLFTFQALTNINLTIFDGGIASVKYLITNPKGHTLLLKTVPGIYQNSSPGYCTNPIIQPTCILNLVILGSALQESVAAGPFLCTLGNISQCYQPNDPKQRLHIVKSENLTVGGAVFGLQGTLILVNNGSDPLTLTADGQFLFPQSLPPGSPYSVSIQNQPANQSCSVINGSGVLAGSSVNNIIVNCSVVAHSIGGNVAGLNGSVTLQNNGTDNLTVNASGFFTFSTRLPEGSPYNVQILNQPNTQICTLSNNTGTVGTSDITTVQVTCADAFFTVGGNIIGIVGPNTVTLLNNGIDPLTRPNGPFTFSIPVAKGSLYHVTVLVLPPGQACSVANSTGIMGEANVTNVAVTCTSNVSTLSISPANLALSVNNPALNPALTGKPRILTITNTGAFATTGFAININPGLPAGTISTGCVAQLAPGGSCQLIITPGSTPTSDGTNPCNTGTGTAPIPSAVQATASNSTNTATANVVVLSYGCIYQSGYLFSVNDSTPNTTSIAGKVAATLDETAQKWALGSSSTSATSNINGQTNTLLLTNPPGSFPAAQACINKSTGGFNDWFLPAICELGYDVNSSGSGCGSAVAPLIQNMESNLTDLGFSSFGNNDYWSSTEDTTLTAWLEQMTLPGQTTVLKTISFVQRCARFIT